MALQITSKDNPKYKRLLHWQKPRQRKKDGVVVVEGLREVKMALSASYELLEVFYCKELISTIELEYISALSKPYYELPSFLFKNIAYREDTEAIVAIFEEKVWPKDLFLNQDRLRILILENTEKPGNLGAVLRTANALGIDAVLSTEQAVDLYHPNVIRSSMGAIFKTPCWHMSNTEAMQWLKERNIEIYASSVDFSESLHTTVFQSKSAVVLGNEAKGISDFWLQHTMYRVKIPMYGQVSSFNVSVAAAIFVYEMDRQRTASEQQGNRN